MNYRWLLDVALQWGLIIGATALALRYPLLWPLAFLFYGTRQAALSVAGHDAAHWQVCRDRRGLNDALGALAMWPLVMSIAGYRRFHLAHHSYLGSAADAELSIMKRHWGFWTPADKGWQTARDLFGAGLPEIIDLQRTMARGRPLEALPMQLTAATVIAILLYLGLWLPLLLWFAALGTVFFALVRIRSWTEHFDDPPDGTWGYPGRTWYERALAFPLGIEFHPEHHRWPWLPWRELRARHAARTRPWGED